VGTSSRVAAVAVAFLLTACSRAPQPAAQPLSISLAVPDGDVAGEVSWSPDRRCAAVVLSNRHGHSPITTTRVAVIEPGVDGYREIRLPEPNERFSTMFDRWEGPGVLIIRATTLDRDISARYSCSSRTLEVVP
jgi:hypothetical protein